MNKTENAFTILVTRPGSAGQELCASINSLGGDSIYFPTIEFTPPEDEKAFTEAVNRMGEQDWLIFNSPQAVKTTVPLMRKTWPQFPDTVKLAAVGGGTAKALKDAGYIVNTIPEDEWSSEGLLALPEFQSVSGKKIMIVRGAGGRELLDREFAGRGAVVTPCISYQRVIPEADTAPYVEMVKKNEITAVAAGSFESVNNLKLLMGDECWQELRALPLLVMSERIRKHAAEAGFQTIWVTRNPSRQALLDLITEKKEVLCLTNKNSLPR